MTRCSSEYAALYRPRTASRPAQSGTGSPPGKPAVPGDDRPVNLVADFYELLADLGAAAWDADDPP